MTALGRQEPFDVECPVTAVSLEQSVIFLAAVRLRNFGEMTQFSSYALRCKYLTNKETRLSLTLVMWTRCV